MGCLPRQNRQDAIARLLQPGETVIWRGRAEPAAYLRRYWPLNLLGLVICAAACLWLLWGGIGAAKDPSYAASGQLLLRHGVPAIAVAVPGLYLMFGVYVRAALRERRALYVLTDRHAIARGLDGRLVAVELRDVAAASFAGNIAGNVVFETFEAQGRKVVFEGIRDPERVRNLAADAVARARRSP